MYFSVEPSKPVRLTPQNFKLRYSPNAVFFDGNDTFLSDSDGTIAWDPTRHLAQFTTGASLADGYYMLELRGSSGGIAAPNGMLLDGEFMNSRIVGNTTAAFWSDSPSGNGIAGGDYRSVFSVAVSRLQIVVNPSSISEFNGQTTATITRLNPDDLLVSQTVFISSSDTTEAIAPASVTIPAGQASVTFTINALDDNILDGPQTVSLLALSQWLGSMPKPYCRLPTMKHYKST